MIVRYFAAVAAVFLASAAEPVRVERRIPLRDNCRESVCTFPAPDGLDESHVRLLAQCNGKIVVNGVSVGKRNGAWPLSGYLSWNGENQVQLPAGCENQVLSLTPKVYIVSMELKRDSGEGRLIILVENALENTANVSLEASAGGARAELSGDVPAYGVRQFDLEMKLGTKRHVKIEALMHKGPEAVEGSYLFEKTQIFE